MKGFGSLPPDSSHLPRLFQRLYSQYETAISAERRRKGPFHRFNDVLRAGIISSIYFFHYHRKIFKPARGSNSQFTVLNIVWKFRQFQRCKETAPRRNKNKESPNLQKPEFSSTRCPPASNFLLSSTQQRSTTVSNLELKEIPRQLFNHECTPRRKT